MQRGPPAGEVPCGHGHAQAISETLYGDAPIRKTEAGERHARDAGNDQRDKRHVGRFLDPQVAEEIGAGRRAERGNDEREEREPREGREVGLAKPQRNERSAEVQYYIYGRGTKYVEPEHGVEVAVGRLAFLVECGDEAALLQRVGDEGEDGEHPHHAVVGWREQAGEEDAEDEVEQLLRTVANSSPQQPLGGFVFQALFGHAAKLRIFHKSHLSAKEKGKRFAGILYFS